MKWLAAGIAALAIAFSTGAQAQKPETSKVRLAVGGKSSLYYLPLTITERLGYFKEAGLDVEISDFAGVALGLRKEKAANYTGPKDLKGMKVGVTAPGSSTHFMVLYMMAQAGLKPDDAVFIGTGSGGTVVAAVQHGEVEGTTKVYGGPYPAAVLYTSTAFVEKNPNTIQALVNAFVRGLKWVQAHNADEIAKMMPEEYMLGEKPLFVEAIKANRDAYSPDGRFLKDAPETEIKVLQAFDRNVKK